MATKQVAKPGCAIDCGTMNLVGARRASDGSVITTRVRNAFIDLPLEHKRMLKLSNTSFAELDGRLVVVGDSALETANLLNKDARRPMSGGVVAAGELDAQRVIALIMKEVLGDPIEKGEKCCYSIPAPAIDTRGSDVIYHSAILKKVLQELGYSPEPANEAMAIIYSECLKENFSGLAISYGCLTPDTKIFTRKGIQPINAVIEGDEVLTRLGVFSKVSKTWTKKHSGPIYELDFFGNPDLIRLTGNHKIWVNRDNLWQWVETKDLTTDDIVGEPIVRHTNSDSYRYIHIKEKRGNCPSKSRPIRLSYNVCRFLGYFLSDGSVGPKSRGTIQIDFGPEEQLFADDLKTIVRSLFNREVSYIKHGRAIRCTFSHKSLCAWLRNHCYVGSDKTKRKIIPFDVETLSHSERLGFIVGMFRGDGYYNKYDCGEICKFGNSSDNLISACHMLLGMSGITSTISRRDPRSSIMLDGRKIISVKPEWIVSVCGDDAKYLRMLLQDMISDGFKNQKIWKDCGFRCTRIRSINVKNYDGFVHDITVDGDPSFAAPYITMHNSGMTNVCLSVNAMSAFEFSLGRGGDFIDTGAARAVGTTAARICSIKETEFDASHTGSDSREVEAISVFVQSLIDYTIDQIIETFQSKKSEIHISKPIPIVVSGGTSLAKGFLDKFRERFNVHKSKFPIQISEIRHATNPMTSVANGLLMLSMMDDN